jgi:tRNA U55 pseudouridine synthase TruB
MPHGWIILDKPAGAWLDAGGGGGQAGLREAGLGKVKVGHGGTLDPLATGVLPIALGEATKLAGRMLDASKEYAFTVAFGAQTDTLDLEGQGDRGKRGAARRWPMWRSGAAALHRADRASAARLFGADGRWPARL